MKGQQSPDPSIPSVLGMARLAPVEQPGQQFPKEPSKGSELRPKGLRRAGWCSSRSWPRAQPCSSCRPPAGIPGDPGQDGSARGAVPGLPHCPHPSMPCHLHAMSPRAAVGLCCSVVGREAPRGSPGCVCWAGTPRCCLCFPDPVCLLRYSSPVPGKTHWASAPESGAGSLHTLGMRWFVALPGFQAVGECGY